MEKVNNKKTNSNKVVNKKNSNNNKKNTIKKEKVNRRKIIRKKKVFNSEQLLELKNNFKNIKYNYFNYVVKDIKIKKKKLRIDRIVRLIILIISLILIIICSILLKNKIDYEKEQERIRIERENKVIDINKHYNKYLKSNKDSNLYKLVNNKYINYGIIYKDNSFEIDEINIDYNTEYFYIRALDCYIKYEDCDIIDNLDSYSDRYKKYILFNNNLITNDHFTLIDSNNNKIYSFNEQMEFKIIIKNYNNNYGIEFNNRLLFINKSDINKIIDSNNTKKNNIDHITTLCYHRVYSKSDKCNDIYICRSKSKFDKDMDGINSRGYFSITLEEMYMYLKGNIRLPKSVLITFDDGYLIDSANEILNKYNMNGVSFVIVNRFENKLDKYYNLSNVELGSHTYNMHNANECHTGLQGGGILCKSKKYVLDDLNKSRSLLKNTIGLAYPFYDFDYNSKNYLKEAGYKLGFAGALGTNGRSYVGTDNYEVPRMTIWDDMTTEEVLNYL